MLKRYLFSILLLIEVAFIFWWHHFINETDGSPSASYIHFGPTLFTIGDNIFTLNDIILDIVFIIFMVTLIVGLYKIIKKWLKRKR